MRYTFCRLMGEVQPIQIVKVLMRHATIALTADLYGKLGIDDLEEKVWNQQFPVSRKSFRIMDL